MDPKKLIEAKMNGADTDRLLHAVRTDRDEVSSLPEDQLEFFESMLSEVREAVGRMEQSIKSDNLSELKNATGSVRDIFKMVEDACDDAG